MLNKYLNNTSVLLLGNGLNRYPDDPKGTSWKDALLNLSKYATYKLKDIPDGFPYTEVFDIIFNNSSITASDLKKEFIKDLKNWAPRNHHKSFLDKCIKNKCNIITTNFDMTLENAMGFVKREDRKLNQGFSSYYPWQRYYGKKLTKKNQIDSIKIWHMHGSIDYLNSIKLSIHDYAGNYNHFKKFDPLPTRVQSNYSTDYTWINEFMEKRLVIVGLSLEEQEFFIRSLLYKKKKYIDLKPNGYYFQIEKYDDPAKKERRAMLLKSAGIMEIVVKDADELYGN